MRILILDIETSPYTALVWGVRKQYLTSKNLLDTASVLCWAAKWHGDDHVYFDSLNRNSEKGMLQTMHAMLEEADVVITYNGNSFDLPTLNREFLKNKMLPPSPYRSLDLYLTMRRKFRFASHKLDDILRELGYGGKTAHRGLALWLDCMNGDKSAWAEMEEYNTNDVTELESLYNRVLPWITNHPNRSLMEERLCCTNCGGEKFHKRGPRILRTGLYQRYQCQSCGHWQRGSKRLDTPGDREYMVTIQ